MYMDKQCLYAFFATYLDQQYWPHGFYAVYLDHHIHCILSTQCTWFINIDRLLSLQRTWIFCIHRILPMKCTWIINNQNMLYTRCIWTISTQRILSTECSLITGTCIHRMWFHNAFESSIFIACFLYIQRTKINSIHCRFMHNAFEFLAFTRFRSSHVSN